MEIFKFYVRWPETEDWHIQALEGSTVDHLSETTGAHFLWPFPKYHMTDEGDPKTFWTYLSIPQSN